MADISECMAYAKEVLDKLTTLNNRGSFAPLMDMGLLGSVTTSTIAKGTLAGNIATYAFNGCADMGLTPSLTRQQVDQILGNKQPGR